MLVCCVLLCCVMMWQGALVGVNGGALSGGAVRVVPCAACTHAPLRCSTDNSALWHCDRGEVGAAVGEVGVVVGTA